MLICNLGAPQEIKLHAQFYRYQTIHTHTTIRIFRQSIIVYFLNNWNRTTRRWFIISSCINLLELLLRNLTLEVIRVYRQTSDHIGLQHYLHSKSHKLQPWSYLNKKFHHNLLASKIHPFGRISLYWHNLHFPPHINLIHHKGGHILVDMLLSKNKYQTF